MQIQQVKKGRGRPKNSLTLQSVSLSELISKFGPDTQIPVGRIWLQGKTQVTQFTPVVAQPQVAPVVPENKVEMSLTID